MNTLELLLIFRTPEVLTSQPMISNIDVRACDGLSRGPPASNQRLQSHQ